MHIQQQSQRLLIYFAVVILVMCKAVLGQQHTIAAVFLINEESLDKTEQALAAHQSVSAHIFQQLVYQMFGSKRLNRQRKVDSCGEKTVIQRKRERAGCPPSRAIMAYRTSSHLSTQCSTLPVLFSLSLWFHVCLFISLSLSDPLVTSLLASRELVLRDLKL